MRSSGQYGDGGLSQLGYHSVGGLEVLVVGEEAADQEVHQLVGD